MSATSLAARLLANDEGRGAADASDDPVETAVQSCQAAGIEPGDAGFSRFDRGTEPFQPIDELFVSDLGGVGIRRHQHQPRAPRHGFADPQTGMHAVRLCGDGARSHDLGGTRKRPQRGGGVGCDAGRAEGDQQWESGEEYGDDHRTYVR